ncbi:MAG: class I SAM-dependent methyltransferase [Chloroflexi bacterium]|nr:class I SAM-dependent methyltransferase [Chloroflexota bacterium]
MRFDFSFDQRVARQYEAQRAHPAEVSQSIGQAIAREAGVGARVLEIGIGTGRIARPVVAAGCRVVGFDVSANMLREVLGDERPFPPHALSLLQADMHDMPFGADSFDAVMAVHVLHLARNWQQVVHEIARVLRRDGAFIQGDDWIDPQSVVGRLRDELRRLGIALSPNMMPPAAGVSKQQVLADLGGVAASEVIAAEWVTWISPAERLQAIENKMDAESWFLPEDIFNTLLPQLRLFAAENWPDLAVKQAVTRRFILKITRGSW